MLDVVKSLIWTARKWREYHQDWSSRIGKMGANCRLASGMRISSPENLTLGDGVIIQGGTLIHCEGGVTIGSHAVISYECAIWTDNHRYLDGAKLPFDETSLGEAVTVGECVWMGFRSMIVPGVTIGEGAVVAMGAVVASDVPPLAVVAGCPARVVKMRDPAHYYRLKADGAFFQV